MQNGSVMFRLSSYTRSRPSRPWPAIMAAGALLGLVSQRDAITRPLAAAADIAELWQEPVALERRDLSTGTWEAAFAPNAHARFRFVKPKTSGTNPGMTVLDPDGREWHVKQGREAAPETVASLVLSALGYHQPPVYFLPRFELQDASGVHWSRGGRFRLKTPSLQDRGEWKWEANPFIGTKPYEGLLVILVMLNSADLKDSNNSVYEPMPPRAEMRRWYVVRDLGTSLGETSRLDPTPNDLEEFERRPFINGLAGGFVAFAYHGVHSDLIHRRITPDDVRWASRLIGRLTDRQWRNAFQYAGYDSGTAERFIRRIQQKVREGMAVADGAPMLRP